MAFFLKALRDAAEDAVGLTGSTTWYLTSEWKQIILNKLGSLTLCSSNGWTPPSPPLSLSYGVSACIRVMTSAFLVGCLYLQKKQQFHLLLFDHVSTVHYSVDNTFKLRNFEFCCYSVPMYQVTLTFTVIYTLHESDWQYSPMQQARGT